MRTRDPLREGSTPSMSIEELQSRLHEDDLTIVDVRSLAAYNGWRLGAGRRGGHIPGAVAFPAEWLVRLEHLEVDRLLRDKRMLPDRCVVLYGDERDDPSPVASRLRDAGIEAMLLDGGWVNWASDRRLPVHALANFQRLVHVEWLRALLDGRPIEAPPAGPHLVCHVNFGLPQEYAEAHIPGAVHLDTNWLEDPLDWNRRAPDALDDALRRMGITADTAVILYGRDTEGSSDERWPGRKAGQLAATRAALLLRYAGVEDVRLLDGGYNGWVQAGHPVESTMHAPNPVDAFGVAIPRHPELIVDLDEVKQVLADASGASLVSVRSWQEHVGATSGYPYISSTGRIAGDVWGNRGSDAPQRQPYRNADNTIRAYPEIADNWAKAGITPDKRVVFYCGTGWRASEAWFCADLLGWPRIGVYDGGWFEWSKDPVHNPIATGEPGDAVRS